MVVKIGIGVSDFVMKMLKVFPFLKKCSCPESDGRFRYLVSKFNSVMEVLYKVNEIKKLARIHRSNIISVSIIELGHLFVVLL